MYVYGVDRRLPVFCCFKYYVIIRESVIASCWTNENTTYRRFGNISRSLIGTRKKEDKKKRKKRKRGKNRKRKMKKLEQTSSFSYVLSKLTQRCFTIIRSFRKRTTYERVHFTKLPFNSYRV